MNYRPVASLKETIVAGAEFTPDSALRYMNLIEQKKEADSRLQEERENAFFDDNRYVMDVGIEDIDTSDLILTDRQLDGVESINNGSWRTTIEDCYSYRESRNPEEPLSRVKSVSENIQMPTVDTYSLKFEAENMEVLNVDGEEVVEIYIDQDNALTLYLNSDNMEFYQGMYDPPVTQDIERIKRFDGSFDTITIRNNSEAGLKVLESFKPETVKREMSKTEIILGKDIDNLTYIPETQVDDIEEDEKIQNDIQKLGMLNPLPDPNTRISLLETLEEGYLVSEMKLKLFNLINGRRDRIALRYSYLSSPAYLEQVARLTGCEMVSVPQDELLILSKDSIPEWITEFDNEFPEKNSLSPEEFRRVSDYIDYPDFVDMEIPWRESLKSREVLLKMFEEQEIAQDRIVSFYLCPWDYISPTPESVKSAIEYGEELRNAMDEVDDEYNTNLYHSTVVWEQRKIYRRGEFPT